MAGSWGASWLSSWGVSWGFGGTPTPSPDTHDGSPDEWKRHRERLLRQSRAAQKAIYRNVPQAINARKIATDMREHLLPSKHVETPEIVYPPVIHPMERMPLANPMQWLLDDDEEAIGWLM